ncbi:MAG: gliding motility-associated C-terminal domain-containing protein, partial [Bacteroidia bacterium]|nr:gliding motility-associated C-terminal domain-containing protein [Bacteroidia bacterium]
ATICDGGVYNWHGNNYSVAGVYYDNLTTVAGCDSIYELTLTVNLTYIFNETISVCNGTIYNWHGNNYSVTGIYYDSLTTIAGCDSIYQLTLNVALVYSYNESATIYDGEIYNWHSNNYTSAGIYFDSLTTIAGCDSIYQLTLTVNPAVLSVTIIIDSVDCYGDCTGKATVTVTGGIPPYAYLWSDTMQTASIADSLCAGVYFVTISDSISTIVIDTITITEPPMLSDSLTALTPTCESNNNGSADLSVTGGTPPFGYLWSNLATGQDLSNVSAGNYSVTVSDALGCTVVDSVHIENYIPLEIDTTIINASCIGKADGKIILSVSQGYGSYSLHWSNEATTDSISSLLAGDYTVTITSSNGCTVTETITVGEPNLECLFIPNVFTPNGNGQNDTWKFKNVELLGEITLEIEVYNRWNDKIFTYTGSAKDYAKPINQWDGKYKGADVPYGAYVYIIKINDGSDPLCGIVTIIR